MPKRGENIYKRKDGRWEGRIPKGTDQGRRKYRSVYGKSYREVKEKMTAVRRTMQTGACIDQTFGQIAEGWMTSQSVYWKPGTLSAYRQMLHKYILPCLGNVPVSQITNRTMCDFMDSVNRQNKGRLSRNYMFQICSMVRRIMIHADRQSDNRIVVPNNPVNKVQPYHIMLPSESVLSQLQDYLYANREDNTCLGIMLALHTGIRIGELSALQWKDIDLEEGNLYVRQAILRVRDSANRTGDGMENGRENSMGNHPGNCVKDSREQKRTEGVTKIVIQEPKSADSARIIPLPPGLLPALREQRKEDACYVISGSRKPWAEPRTIQYRFQSILKKCGLESFNFHLLRHSFATRCVSMGLDVKSLSEILGHSSIQLTLNLYVHSTIQQKRKLMQQYDAALR